MKPSAIAVFAGAMALGCGLWAQIPPPNAAGVAAGHAHIYTTDQAASTAFWTALGGATLEQGGAFPGIKFPGVIVLFAQTGGGGGRGGAPQTGARGPAATREGTTGSVVDHMGFKVKSLKDTLARLEALGTRPLAGAAAKTAAVLSPEKVKVQLTEDASLATVAASDDVLIKTPDANASAAWYEKYFGAKVVKQAGGVVAQIPGWNLRFVETKEAMAGTRGRALDHIGFDIIAIDAYIKKLGDGGIAVQTFAGRGSAIGFVADPYGVSIELNQGVRDMK